MLHLETIPVLTVTGQTPLAQVISEISVNAIALANEKGQRLGIMICEDYLTNLQTRIVQLEQEKKDLAQRYERERKGIETALQEIEQRYATLVSTAPVGIFRTDIEDNCLYVNDRYCQITGIPYQEIIGINWLKSVSEEDFEPIYQQWKHAKQSQSSFRAEYHLNHPQKGIIWVVGEAVEERNKEGQLLGYIGTITDITERKQTEEALRKSKATKQALLSALPDMLFLQNQDGVYLEFVSTGGLEPLIPPSEFLGKHHVEILPPQLSELANHAIRQAIQTKQVQTFEYCIRITEQDCRYYEAKIISTETGEILSIIRDISERQQAIRALQKLNIELENRVEQRTLALKDSEERFRKIFEESPLGIALVSLDYHFVRVNAALTQMIGYTEPELQSMTFLDITYPDDIANNLQLASQLFSGEISTYQLEKRYITKNSEIIWVKLITCIIHNSEGKALYGLALVENISEKKQAEMKRYQTEENLKTSLQEKELLLKEVHHRVKNNLQVISSIFSLQSQYIDNPKILSVLTDSQNRISSIALVHEKLYRSANLAKVNFLDYVQTLVYHLLVSYNINANSIYLDLNIENINLDLDRSIACGLLLNELVSNSLKHAFKIEKKDILKIIRIYFTLNIEGNYNLVIEDNGIGFPENLDLNSVSSLGLRLVQALTRQLKGKLEIYHNNGTIFKLTFPQ